MESKELTISWGTLWKVLLMVAFVAIAYVSRSVLLAALLAIIVSAALDPFVTYLERKRIPRIIGTLAIYIIAVFIIALIMYIVVPIFLVQLNSFIVNSQETVGSLVSATGINTSIFDTITGAINQFTANLLGGKTSLVGILSQLLGGVLLTMIVFVISFYLTIARDGVERFFMTVLPLKHQPKVLGIYERVRHKISFWFAGQLFLSLVVGVAVFIGLEILGVKYAFIIAILAGILELVPYVGPIFSGSLATLVALTQSTSLGIYTLILFVVILQTENHALVPLVNRYTTNLNPVVVILALLIGGEAFGIIGAIISVPVAVLFQEILNSRSVSQEV